MTMKQLVLGTILLSLLSVEALAQRTADSTKIQEILREAITSWNSGDALIYSKHFAEDGTFTNIRGMFFVGYKEFLDRHADIFKGMFLNTVLNQQVVSFRFPAADVAVVETLTWITGFKREALPKGIYVDDSGRLHTRLLQVFQKRADAWKIVVYHNVDIKADVPVPPHP
jgi:uncharacterized protein (TIGR02246 family)